MFNNSSRNSTILPSIVAFGNVLLDCSIKIEETNILDRYNLTLDTKGEISLDQLQKISEEIQQKYNFMYNAGGSALNTCRLLKSINGPKVLFFGAIGNDKNGEILKEFFKNNIQTCLQTIENCPTGQSICFIYGDKTALYANVGASIKFNKDFLESSENKFYVKTLNNKKQQIFYIEGFFVTHRNNVCKFIIEKYIINEKMNKNNSKLLAINLSSPYIVRENADIIKYMINYSTLVFGNRNEFLSLADVMKLNSIDDVAKKLISKNKNDKIIVITNGSNDILLYTNLNYDNIENPTIFKPLQIAENDIVDTTGAGDAFVSGFLNSFFNDSKLDECIEDGCHLASLVIKQVGCKIE